MMVLTWTDAPDGRIAEADFLLSPNHDRRPEGMGICLLVVHAISLPPGEFGGMGVEQLFCNRLDAAEHSYYHGIAELRVSSHFYIRRDGRLIQFVPCDMQAWHAGVSNWEGRERCNGFSIGVELEGCDDQEFELEQYRMLNDLIAVLRQRYPIRAVVGHAEIAPGRKTDPGPCFDWSHLVV